MKLCQFHLPGRGPRVGVVEGDRVADVTGKEAPSVRALIEACGTAERLERRAAQIAKRARTRVAWRDRQAIPARSSPAPE